MAVAIVFEPMVPGDDRDAAVAEAARTPDPRLRDFWDENHACAKLWGAAHEDLIVPKLLALMPPDSEEREMVASWDPEEQPLWDAAWFFESDAEWPAERHPDHAALPERAALPEHAAWCKQFDFQLDEEGRVHAGFFRGEGWEAGVSWSSWAEEFAKGMDLAR